MNACFIGLVILTLALASCSPVTLRPAAPSTTSMPAGASPLSDIEEYLNPGEPIRVKAGQKFTIRMASNPITGYGWQLLKNPDENIVQFVNKRYIPPDNNDTVAFEVMTFKAMGAGQTDISMKTQFVRPWAKDQPARTNVFTVIVK